MLRKEDSKNGTAPSANSCCLSLMCPFSLLISVRGYTGRPGILLNYHTQKSAASPGLKRSSLRSLIECEEFIMVLMELKFQTNLLKAMRLVV